MINNYCRQQVYTGMTPGGAAALSIIHVLDTVRGTGDTVENKSEMGPVFMEFTSYRNDKQ